MQELIDKLQSKVKSYKRQFEEAVSMTTQHGQSSSQNQEKLARLDPAESRTTHNVI